MPPASKEKLKKLISKSAIKDSVVPIIVCDENFKVCMKSTGAAKLISKPSVGTSVLPHMPEGTAEKISGRDAPYSTFFETPGGEIFTVITKGIVEGEKYYALIFEPQILFLPSEMPQYVTESYRHLSDAVHELLLSVNEDFSRLEHSVSAVLRLIGFREKRESDRRAAKSGFTDIYAELENVVAECDELLSTVGGAVALRRMSGEPLICTCPAEIIYIFISVLVAAGVLLSEDGYADITCGNSPVGDSFARIEVSVTVDKKAMSIGSFSELTARVVPLSLELAAIEDIAEHYGVKLTCRAACEKLHIGCDIEIRSSASIRLHAPLYHEVPEHLRRMIAELFGVAIANRRF